MSKQRYVEQRVESCPFCRSKALEFTRNAFSTLFAQCHDCGAIVSFRDSDQSPRNFFKKWNGERNAVRVTSVQ